MEDNDYKLLKISQEDNLPIPEDTLRIEGAGNYKGAKPSLGRLLASLAGDSTGTQPTPENSRNKVLIAILLGPVSRMLSL